LCKKTPEEIKATVSDKQALAADLRNYSNSFVLNSARDRVILEVDDQGKELLKDVDPERDVSLLQIRTLRYCKPTDYYI
jgi:hypothetical protein